MELKRYLAVLRRGWWLALPALLVTTGATIALVAQQAPIYKSTSTYVVRPSSLDSADSLRAFDTLVRGVEINATYATIARSDLIRSRARERLQPSTSTDGIAIQAEVITGTNVLSISALGVDPEAVRDVAAVIGEETAAYVGEIRDSYRLEPLDPAMAPNRPVGPKKPLTIAIGIILGAALAGGLALLPQYLRSPAGAGPAAEPDDQFSSLRQEMQRARRDGTRFSFGLVRLMDGHSPGDGAHDPKAAQAVQNRLRDGALLAALDADTLAIMLPGLARAQAENRLVRDLAVAAALDPAAAKPLVMATTSIAVCELRDGRFIGNPTAAGVAELLTVHSSLADDMAPVSRDGPDARAGQP